MCYNNNDDCAGQQRNNTFIQPGRTCMSGPVIHFAGYQQQWYLRNLVARNQYICYNYLYLHSGRQFMRIDNHDDCDGKSSGHSNVRAITNILFRGFIHATFSQQQRNHRYVVAGYKQHRNYHLYFYSLCRTMRHNGNHDRHHSAAGDTNFHPGGTCLYRRYIYLTCNE